MRAAYLLRKRPLRAKRNTRTEHVAIPAPSAPSRRKHRPRAKSIRPASHPLTLPRMTAIFPTPEPLWPRVRASFARAIAAVGDVASIVTGPALSRHAHRRLLGWIRLLEHVVRKLLLAEAAEIHRVAGPRSQQRLAQRTRAARSASRASIDMSCPQTWPARFSFSLPRPPRRTAIAPQPRRAFTEQEECFHLARRLETLRRVLQNPRPHAERLARILARQARCRRDIAALYWWMPARTGHIDPADPRLSIDAYGACTEAPYAFEDTS